MTRFWMCVIRFLHRSMATNSGKKFIRIDISSDTVCPWCFVGKKNLDKAIALTNDQYDFEVPFASVIHISLTACSSIFTGENLLFFFCRLSGIRFSSTLLRLKKGLTRKITTEISLDLALNKWCQECQRFIFYFFLFPKQCVLKSCFQCELPYFNLFKIMQVFKGIGLEYNMSGLT